MRLVTLLRSCRVLTIVHLRPLPGLVDEYRALVDRALAT